LPSLIGRKPEDLEWQRASFGVIPKLGRALASLSAPGTGLLSGQKKNYDNQISTIDKNIDRTEKVVSAKAQSLKDSLSKAQAAIQAIQTQGGAIANSVPSAIPGAPGA
ncbi:hypothetical protein EBT16_14405, partial [bacterium]|nr:hypothetical protein [bacterium]